MPVVQIPDFLKDTAGEWGVSPLGRGEIQEKEDTNSRVIHIFWA